MKLDEAMEIHAGITAGALVAKRCKLLKSEEQAAAEIVSDRPGDNRRRTEDLEVIN